MSYKPLFLATALIVLLAIAGGFWYIQKRQIVVDQPVVTDSVGEAPAQVEPEKYPQHIEVIPGNTDEVWYNIPELGIRMKLNKEFAEDLVYSNGMIDDDGTPRDGIYFSTQAITEAAPECAPGRGGAFGVVSKIAGTVEKADRNGLGLDSEWYTSRLKTGEAVQFPEYFITWSGPQALCEFPVHQGVVQKHWPRDYPGLGAKNVYEGIRTLELIPQNRK